MSKEINTPQNNSEEVDLGQLFKLIGSMFDRFFRFLGNILNKIFLAFVWCVFFVKKHIVILVIAGVLGFGYGLIKEKFSEPVFKSSILMKQNYNTGEALYNTINYYNGLLSQGDYTTLAQELSIDTLLISSIIGFEVKALVTENERLVQYNNYLSRLDSTLASTVMYKDYIQNVEDHIYNSQELTINSRTNKNFNIVFESIVNSINSNVHFKREQTKDLKELENRKLAIQEALAESDTLQIVYKKVLESTPETQNGSQTSITIEGNDEKNTTKEFDLYKSDIELRRELVTIERETQNKEFIVEILSNTPSRGFIDSSIKVLNKAFSPTIFFASLFFFILFSILLLLRFINFLEKFKSKV